MSTNDLTQITQSAREKAEKTIDAALGELHEAAHEIGVKYGIPENIAGHSVSELMGRMGYVPSMARDLRMACGQELARIYLDELISGQPPPAPAHVPTTETPPPPPAPTGEAPVGLDLSDLPGITVQTVKACKAANLHTVGDVVKVPDEHMLKIDGIAEKSLAQLRGAIAKASTTSAG